MEKSHTEPSAPGASAKGTLRRLFERVLGGRRVPSLGDVDPRMLLLTKTLNDAAAKRGMTDDDEGKARAAMMEFILPRLLTFKEDVPGHDGVMAIQVNNPKAWAYACAQMLGLCAGLGLEESAIDDGLAEVLGVAKLFADMTVVAVTKSRLKVEGKAEVAAPSIADAVAETQMVTDLQKQADDETDPAMKAALLAMMANLKKGNIAA